MYESKPIDYLIRFISKRVKDEYIKNRCLEQIKANEKLTYSWYIITNFKFNENQKRIVSEYNFNLIKDFNY